MHKNLNQKAVLRYIECKTRMTLEQTNINTCRVSELNYQNINFKYKLVAKFSILFKDIFTIWALIIEMLRLKYCTLLS